MRSFSRHRRSAGTAVACTVVVLALTACDGGRPAAAPANTSVEKVGSVTRNVCANPSQRGPGVECGTIVLPIDWTRPDGPTWQAEFYTQKAKSGPVKGTFLAFPPGPGDAADFGFTTVAAMSDQYDMIGINPRGVTESYTDPRGLECETRAILDSPPVPPSNEPDFARMLEGSAALARSCRTEPAALREHLDAYDNARDADALRAALGIDQVNLYALSYGTVTAERYLELFGTRVRASILEGVMSPAQSVEEFMTAAAAAAQRAFDDFARWCTDTPECPLPEHDARTALAQARAAAREGRIPPIDLGLVTRPWDEVLVVTSLEGALSGPFPDAAAMLARLAAGQSPDSAADRPGQDPSDARPERMRYTGPLVCADFDLGVRSFDSASRILRRMREAAPDLWYNTNSSEYLAMCADMPRPAQPGRPVRSIAPHPTMLLSRDNDLATPRDWANQVAAQLGPDTKHFVSPGIGHGVDVREPATAAAVQAYLDSVNP
ncbi:alpha/beta fold hydrolase [Nocardia brasiliensis]|uniref:alpha/beta fold hydrolase n=1 Tax=Nocardia brasiliensis TaxID=37326 RepID=UPI00379FFDDB